MKEVVIYRVVPHLPDRLQPLMEMARNLWFSWHTEVIDLFRSVDQNLWEETGHNPLAMLGRLSRERILELLADDGFLLEMERIGAEFQRYLEDRRPYDFGLENPLGFTVAYFSAEYGLTDCLPIYSGGLGVLSGDHVKSASDLRIPLVGVGLMYQKGYFRQYLNADGWQQETYPENDFASFPAALERDGKGQFMVIDVPIQERLVKAHLWRIQVGRVPLFLLDTNNVENADPDREITAALYGGDREMRLKQEIVLGIGGVRALTRMGIRPDVLHMNEGHSALAILERIRLLMEEHRLAFGEAREAVYASSVFTTHTPVPAGIDIFDRGLITSYLGSYARSLGIAINDLLNLGAQDANPQAGFNMAVMALKNAARSNGVSDLHKQVSRRMWSGLWPDLPLVDMPIAGVTNGIHIPSWISNDMLTLFDRYLGRRWAEDPDNIKVWERVNRIPDAELWRTHERRRERLVAFTRQRLQEQFLRRGAHKTDIQAASEVLHPQALTIGFGRRFATYKRGNLILKDPARLARILNDPGRPVQVLFAGKAHPQDNAGKEVIKEIVHLAHQPEFRYRLALVEDYDLNVSRYMVQGADVWLNNPRRPLEACGTSGMKAAANGALNLSVPDGWWAEGYEPGLGWAIGSGEDYDDPAYQDQVESQTLYHLLENHIVPLFYDRGRDGLPREWIAMMKASMSRLAARFNAHRMLQDYIAHFYLPAAHLWQKIEAEAFAGARALYAWEHSLRGEWPKMRILEKKVATQEPVRAGESLRAEVWMELGKISPGDLSVDFYYGPVDSRANFLNREILCCSEFKKEGGRTVFCSEIPCPEVGRFGFRVRVLPRHPLLANPYALGLILWG